VRIKKTGPLSSTPKAKGTVARTGARLAEPKNAMPLHRAAAVDRRTKTRVQSAMIIARGLAALRKKPSFDLETQKLLREFGAMFHAGKVVVESGGKKRNLLDVKDLSKLAPKIRNGLLERLELALRARIGATIERPTVVHAGGIALSVHNAELARLIADHYGAEALSSIQRELTALGVFAVHIDPVTGLVRTADAKETWEMSERQWTTDSVMCGPLERDKDPEGWKKNLMVLAASMNCPAALESFEKAIGDPDWYRKGGKKNGIPHIILPASVRWDDEMRAFDASQIEIDEGWENQQRLESQALALQALTRAARTRGEAEALTSSPEMKRQSRDAIVNLVRFLISVNSDPETGTFDFGAPTQSSWSELDFAAPSASSWEEKPFPKGMTWDAAACVMAMESVRELLFGADAKSELASAVRDDPRAAALTLELLDRFIESGRRMIDERVVKRLEQGLTPMQHPDRHADTSLMFLAASDYRFHPKDPVADARVRFQLVTSLKAELMRDHGMIRYGKFVLEEGGRRAELHDSYLNRDYWMPTQLRGALSKTKMPKREFGSKDAGSLEAMVERQVGSSEGSSAQWCLGVSAALQAVAKARLDVLEHTRRTGAKAPELLALLDRETDEMVSRNLALISGGGTKSTGHPCPPNRVMEAYEAVTDLSGRIRFMPGAHPLSWGAAQLYDGLQLALQGMKNRP
jgi:hypothetical protein